MAFDMFNRRAAQYGGSISVDRTSLTFPGLRAEAAFIPYIVTQMGLQYGQQISRVYGLNTARVVLVSGRPSGNATLQQIISPGGSLASFYRTYGDTCAAGKNAMAFSLQQGCDDNSVYAYQRFVAGTVIAQSLGLNVGADQGLVSNGTQLSFESLEYYDQ